MNGVNIYILILYNMDQISVVVTKAANHINLKNDLVEQGIDKETAAILARVYLFKLSKQEKNKVISILMDY